MCLVRCFPLPTSQLHINLADPSIQIKLRPEADDEIEHVRVRTQVHTHSPARRSSRVIVKEQRSSYVAPPRTTYPVPTPAPLAIPAPQPVPVFVAPTPPPHSAPPSPRPGHIVEVVPGSESSRSSHDEYVYERRREVRRERSASRRRDYSPARSERDDRYEYRYLDAPGRDHDRAHFSRRRESRSPSRSRSVHRDHDDGYRTTKERVVYHVDRRGNRDDRYYD